MPILTKRWKCVHCGKVSYANKNTTIKHEEKCVYNEDNKCCGSCKHFIMDDDFRCGFHDKILIAKQKIDIERLKKEEMFFQKDCKDWTEKEC